VMNHVTNRIVGAAVASAIVALAALCPGPGHAQQSRLPGRFTPPADLAEAFQPDILRSELELFDEHFGLTDDQSLILKTLHSDYLSEFHAQAAEMRARIAELRPNEQQQRELQLEQHRLMRRQIEALMDRIQELKEIDTPESEQQIERLTERVRQLKLEMRQGGAGDVDLDAMRQLMQQFNAVISEWNDRKQAMRDAFMTDARSLLDDTQNERWPAFQRKLRRVKTLSDGRLSGESVDLLELVDALELSEERRSDLDRTLHQFTIELDDALRARNDFLERSRAEHADVLATGDLRAARSLIDREVSHRVAVRDVIVRYAESVAGQLSSEAGAALRSAFERAAFPRAFRTTLAERSFDAMLQLPELDPDDRAAIEQIETEYVAVLERQRRTLIDLIREHEPQQMRDRFLLQVARSAALEPVETQDNPMVEALRQLREHDRRYIDRALAVLDDDQIQRLPGFVRSGDTDSPQDDAPAGPRSRAFPDMTAAEKQALADQFDADGNGYLDHQERAELRAELQRRMQAAEAEDQID